MPDSKITALTSIGASTDPANDPLVLVDVSDTSMAASGTTKKVTLNQLLGASGTATLASATISGDLTVDTSTLKVDSANNRVGIKTATPTAALQIASGNVRVDDGYQFEFGGSTNGISGSNASNNLSFYTNNTIAYSIGSAGGGTWYVSGSTAMTLNSTGLGVGVTPSAGRLHIKGGASQSPLVLDTLGYNQIVLQLNGANRGQIYADATNCFALVDSTGSNSRLLVTDSGNVGVGVTPTNIAGVTRFEIKGSVSSQVVIRSGSANASARDWMISANFNAFGDFVIRQGNSQGADPNSGTDRLVIDASGRPIFYSGVTTPATLSTNGQLTMTATSDTNLRFSYRGSDGVTRVANLTLA